MSPYDWQESIAQRAQYVESRLKTGLPAAAVSLPEGILIGSLRRQSTKLFEVYDSLAMAALGIQSDVEALRVAAIEFCHKEGYQRSAEDVTIRRVAAGLSASIKKSFADLRTAPFAAVALFAELGDSPEHDRFALLDYDGDYRDARSLAVISGTAEGRAAVEEALAGLAGPLDEASSAMERAFRTGREETGSLVFEAALLDRANQTDRKFRLVAGIQDA